MQGFQLENIDPIKQVASKFTARDGSPLVAVGGNNAPHIKRNGLGESAKDQLFVVFYLSLLSWRGVLLAEVKDNTGSAFANQQVVAGCRQNNV